MKEFTVFTILAVASSLEFVAKGSFFLFFEGMGLFTHFVADAILVIAAILFLVLDKFFLQPFR